MTFFFWLFAVVVAGDGRQLAQILALTTTRGHPVVRGVVGLPVKDFSQGVETRNELFDAIRRLLVERYGLLNGLFRLIKSALIGVQDAFF